jgi:hypothetical protein
MSGSSRLFLVNHQRYKEIIGISDIHNVITIYSQCSDQHRRQRPPTSRCRRQSRRKVWHQANHPIRKQLVRLWRHPSIQHLLQHHSCDLVHLYCSPDSISEIHHGSRLPLQELRSYFCLGARKRTAL